MAGVRAHLVHIPATVEYRPVLQGDIDAVGRDLLPLLVVLLILSEACALRFHHAEAVLRPVATVAPIEL